MRPDAAVPVPAPVRQSLLALIAQITRHDAYHNSASPKATALDLLCMRWHDRDGIPQRTIAKAWGVTGGRIWERVHKGRRRMSYRVRRAEARTRALMHRYRVE